MKNASSNKWRINDRLRKQLFCNPQGNNRLDDNHQWVQKIWMKADGEQDIP